MARSGTTPTLIRWTSCAIAASPRARDRDRSALVDEGQAGSSALEASALPHQSRQSLKGDRAPRIASGDAASAQFPFSTAKPSRAFNTIRPSSPAASNWKVEQASEALPHRNDLRASFADETKADALRDILRVGASAGGARAKAVIAWNPATNELRSGQSSSTASCERLNRALIFDKRPVGDTSRVQMVAPLEAAAATAQRYGMFPRLAGWITQATEGLRKRWPDADVDLTRYSPYTPRT